MRRGHRRLPRSGTQRGPRWPGSHAGHDRARRADWSAARRPGGEQLRTWVHRRTRARAVPAGSNEWIREVGLMNTSNSRRPRRRTAEPEIAGPMGVPSVLRAVQRPVRGSAANSTTSRSVPGGGCSARSLCAAPRPVSTGRTPPGTHPPQRATRSWSGMGSAPAPRLPRRSSSRSVNPTLWSSWLRSKTLLMP